MFNLKFNDRIYSFKIKKIQEDFETIKDFIMSNKDVAEYDLSNVNFKAELYILDIVLIKLSHGNNMFNSTWYSLNEFEAWYEITDYLGFTYKAEFFGNDKELFLYLYNSQKYYLIEHMYKCETIRNLAFSYMNNEEHFAFCVNYILKNYVIFKYDEIKNKRYDVGYDLLEWNEKDKLVETGVKYEDNKIYINDTDYYDKRLRVDVYFGRNTVIVMDKKDLNKDKVEASFTDISFDDVVAYFDS